MTVSPAQRNIYSGLVGYLQEKLPDRITEFLRKDSTVFFLMGTSAATFCSTLIRRAPGNDTISATMIDLHVTPEEELASSKITKVFFMALQLCVITPLIHYISTKGPLPQYQRLPLSILSAVTGVIISEIYQTWRKADTRPPGTRPPVEIVEPTQSPVEKLEQKIKYLQNFWVVQGTYQGLYKDYEQFESVKHIVRHSTELLTMADGLHGQLSPSQQEQIKTAIESVVGCIRNKKHLFNNDPSKPELNGVRARHRTEWDQLCTGLRTAAINVNINIDPEIFFTQP